MTPHGKTNNNSHNNPLQYTRIQQGYGNTTTGYGVELFGLGTEHSIPQCQKPSASPEGCHIKPEDRHIRQDAYRVCFKNETGDDMSDNDEQDLTHLLKVIATALAVIATRRVARGHIDVPKDFDGGMMNVNTIQGLDAP